MDKARIHDLEGLYSAAQCLVEVQEGEINALRDNQDDLQAQAAAMREILETVPEMCLAAGDVRVYSYRGLYEQADKAQAEYRVMLDKWAAALAPDAGRALLERLAKAEAELESYKQWETNIRQANDIGDISLTDWASF